LDVDFYFEEMSIEKITERPAYDEESLFGEYQCETPQSMV
jgi:hypothetical protein